MEEMDTPTRRTLYRLYRHKHFPHITAFFSAIGIFYAVEPGPLDLNNHYLRLILRVTFAVITTLNTSYLIAIIWTRILYRRNPYCAACGLDEVDCKMNRNSISRHEPAPRQ